MDKNVKSVSYVSRVNDYIEVNGVASIDLVDGTLVINLVEPTEAGYFMIVEAAGDWHELYVYNEEV